MVTVDTNRFGHSWQSCGCNLPALGWFFPFVRLFERDKPFCSFVFIPRDLHSDSQNSPQNFASISDIISEGSLWSFHTFLRKVSATFFAVVSVSKPIKCATSAKCKSRTTVLLVQHPAPWSLWSPWSTLIHLGPQFPERGYTKWTKQDHGGPGVDHGHRQDHGARWWTRGVQDHLGSLKHIFLMHFGELVHYHHDLGLSLRFWQLGDEIHGDWSPVCIWYF